LRYDKNFKGAILVLVKSNLFNCPKTLKFLDDFLQAS